jgi:hypothetical protein
MGFKFRMLASNGGFLSYETSWNDERRMTIDELWMSLSEA